MVGLRMEGLKEGSGNGIVSVGRGSGLGWG